MKQLRFLFEVVFEPACQYLPLKPEFAAEELSNGVVHRIEHFLRLDSVSAWALSLLVELTIVLVEVD